jgi:hypothetical protein
MDTTLQSRADDVTMPKVPSANRTSVRVEEQSFFVLTVMGLSLGLELENL